MAMCGFRTPPQEIWWCSTVEGEYLKTVGSKGSGAGQMENPRVSPFDANGHVWVAEWSNDRVEEFNEEGEFVSSSAWPVLGKARSVAVWDRGGPAGQVFVGEAGNDRVQQFNEAEELCNQLGSPGPPRAS